MKKLLVALVVFACAGALTINAAEEKEKQKLTAEQKALQKEIKDKYDANKDGKLDKEERGKISKEDKARMEKAGLAQHKKDKNQ
jgi:hypothetical protein